MAFEIFGFFKEYYVRNKFISSCECEKDREDVGYTGRKTETLSDKIVFKNGKSIKQGTEVVTIIYPLCGKQIK